MNHPYYTEIPQRSFDAIVKNGWLSEILLALIIDPLSAEDVADSLVRDGKTKSLIIDPMTKHAKPYPAPIAPSDFVAPNEKIEVQFRITISQWVMHFDEARPALRSLMDYDRRLGVWCMRNVARAVLPFIRKGETRPLRAIETAEAWVRGTATMMEVRNAAVASDYAANAAFGNNAAYYATNAAHAAIHAVYCDAASAHADAGDGPDDAARAACVRFDDAAREAELIRLREVIAEACMTFPIMANQ